MHLRKYHKWRRFRFTANLSGSAAAANLPREPTVRRHRKRRVSWWVYHFKRRCTHLTCSAGEQGEQLCSLQKTSRQDHQLSGPWFSRQMGHRWSCWRRVRRKPKSASNQKNLVLSVEHGRAALVPLTWSSNHQIIKSKHVCGEHEAICSEVTTEDVNFPTG